MTGPNGPQTAVMLFLNQQADKFQAECEWHEQKLRTARTMREVKQLCDVHLRAELRGMPGVRRVATQLHDAGETKMEALLKVQLDALGVLTTSEEFKTQRARHLSQDWVFLRGTFSRVLSRADAVSSLMLHLLVRTEEKASRGQEADSNFVPSASRRSKP